MTLKKTSFMWIAGTSYKHYSKIKDLGIVKDSMYIHKSCEPQVTSTIYLDCEGFRKNYCKNYSIYSSYDPKRNMFGCYEIIS